ncbi:MAG TPA: squalene/phytoene synthase family protein [Candidatus Dormibacteraeota bacterium]|nr:squalene/phytoene synthase family protein [Candidatus Dormibacteraeota bacterium]
MTGVAIPPRTRTPAAMAAVDGAVDHPGLPGGLWTLEPLSPPDGLARADAMCRRLAARHYENFTAVSRIAPVPVRTHLARVYAYCRVTDDLGDELGAASGEALASWRAEVEGVLLRGAAPRTSLMLALGATVRARALPAAPFLDLIAANVQDQAVHAYETWPELLAYCRLSAAPVGRMVLGVVGVADPRAARLSDDVCVGLQLANFAQDVSVDAARGRRYLVGDDVRAAGVEGAVRAMCDRADALLRSGEELEGLCSGWLRAQLALYRLGGRAIVASVRAAGYATDRVRPHLGPLDRVRIAAAAAPALVRARQVDPRVAEAARECAQTARHEAANFYWGFVALPRAQRESIYAVYAFARRVDDVADGPGAGSARVRLDAERRRLRVALSGGADDPVLRMVAVAARRHAIPIEDLDAIVAGVERDAGRVRYATWSDLGGYCRLVASAVGRICVRIFGYTDPAALVRADELGMAMQLTNILRDVREDASLGRVYLPREDLEAAGIDGEEIVAAAAEERPARVDQAAWARLVAVEAERAEGLFASGLGVCDLIPYRAATCVRTMAGIYRALLADIEARPAVVLSERLSLSPARKLGVLARSVATVGARR